MEYAEVKQQVLDEFEFWRMSFVTRVQGPADAVEKALREVLAETILDGNLAELKALRARFDQRIRQLVGGA